MIRFGGVFNNTGYGIAARDTAYAMIEKGIPLTIKQLPATDKRDDSSIYQQRVNQLINKNIDYKINIAQIIPPMWNQVFEKNTWNIGYFFWETDRICKEWADILNGTLVNEIWVPCEYNRQACINSGVKKPIYVVPQCTTLSKNENSSYEIDFIKNDAFKFYSIFQWTERKNGAALIRSYVKEFEKDDNVILALKTHRFSYQQQEKNALRDLIINIKNSVGKKSAPPIYLIKDNLPYEILSQLHRQCDCYVTVSRGEGWSMPIAEAMACGKPVITTQTGGITEYLNNDNAYIVPHRLEYVTGMPWIKWYTSEQKWGATRDSEIRSAMRLAYNERKNFLNKTEKYDDILDSVSVKAIGETINNRIDNILKML